MRWRLFPCFVVVEDTHGRVQYVSEVQEGRHSVVRFNELPVLEAAESQVVLRLVGQLPEPEFAGEWAEVARQQVDLNALHYVGHVELVDGLRELNVPVLEFADGHFAAARVPGRLADGAPGKFPARRSFSFNALLKLNKILEYMSQVEKESQQLVRQAEALLGQSESKQLGPGLDSAFGELEVQRKRKLAQLSALQDHACRLQANPDDEESFDSDYGSMYSELIQKKQRVHLLQERKLQRLIEIFTNTSLFSSPYVVVRTSTDSSPYDISLGKLELQTILDVDDRISINTILGYYLLFLDILAGKICYIPLPHRLAYYGSTSIIDNKFPLYLPTSSTQHHLDRFSEAVHLFNINIIQVRQFLNNLKDK